MAETQYNSFWRLLRYARNDWGSFGAGSEAPAPKPTIKLLKVFDFLLM